MYEKLNNNDIVITNNKIKILKYLNNQNKMLNLKIMTKQEFINDYFGYVDERAIYYLVKKYNYKYEIAKMYLDNFLFNQKLKEELIENNLVNYKPLFKKSIKRIVIDNIKLDPYIMEEIKKYDYLVLENIYNNINNPIYEFQTIDDEINFVIDKIMTLEKGNLNQFHLVNVGNEYIIPLKRLFKLYNIPININEKISIYGMIEINAFLNKLKQEQNLEASINCIENIKLKKIITDIINKYSFVELDDTVIYLIEQEIRNKKISRNKLDNAVNIVKLDDITNDGYYFILGFNQGIFPKIYKDEDYLADNEKKKYGLFTSSEKNIIEKEKIKKIMTYENVFISYKLKFDGKEYYKSSLINDSNVIIMNEKKYSYSNLYNKLVLSLKLDNFIKFNEKDDDIDLLYSNYNDIDYLNYDNKYTHIDKEKFYKYINNKLNLSYSSLNNYSKCSFKYYISNILKLNRKEDNFNAYIGNLFHYILSICFKDNFDFEKEYENYIKDKLFTNKELFFINKLKKDLFKIINIIKDQDNYSELNEILTEKEIIVDKSRNIKITFKGYIDKIKYKKEEDRMIVAIIDYKTGNPSINLDDSIYGLNMQLPIYLYLIKNSKIKNVKIAGFYLQKLIHNKLNHQDNYLEEEKKLYRLEGYSTNDTDILEKFDKNYQDSKVIKSMKTTSKGFSIYSKLLTDEEMNNLEHIVDKQIDMAIDKILDTDFSINPKNIDQKLIGCEYCEYRDICYKTDKDIVYLEKQNYKDFLGGDINA